MATNPTLTAQQACDLGIIARVVDDADFGAETEKLLRQLADAPSGSVQRAKRLLRSALSNSLEQHLELESQSIAEIAASPATLATLEAFFAARKK